MRNCAPRRRLRSHAFTLVELLVVIGIIAILISILSPPSPKRDNPPSRLSADRTFVEIGVRSCAISMTTGPSRSYAVDRRLQPARVSAVEPRRIRITLPRRWRSTPARRRSIYCPSNSLGRDVDNWWPYAESGTIASNYQFPFWLEDNLWMIPKPDYRRLTTDRVLAADYLGVILDFENVIHIVAWNHEKIQDGSLRGHEHALRRRPCRMAPQRESLETLGRKLGVRLLVLGKSGMKSYSTASCSGERVRVRGVRFSESFVHAHFPRSESRMVLSADRSLSLRPPRHTILHELLQHDERQQQHADRDLRPPGAERAVEVDDGLNRAEDQHPDQRADEIPDAAGEQRAADDDGGDCVELEHGAGRPVAARGVKRVHDARRARSRSRSARRSSLSSSAPAHP